MKRFDKRYLPMLVIGLALWLGSMLVSYIMEKNGNAPAGQEALMGMGKMAYQQMPVFILLLFCLIQPVLEECSFRLWGVGKTWTIVVSMVLMSLFAVGELKLWSLPFVAAFLVVWLMVKDTFRKNWLLAIVTSLCFALCHISGFGGFSAGMVMGLTDIFGMALVCCWLTINLSFWFSCLLHVANNSLAILVPLLATPDVVDSEHTMAGQQTYNTTISRVEAFAGSLDEETFEGRDEVLNLAFGDTVEGVTYTLVGEPAELAYMLATGTYYDSRDLFFDWKSKGESLEERVRYTIDITSPVSYDPQALFDNFMADAAKYYEEPLQMDTTETTLWSIYLVYPDTTLNILDANEMDYYTAYERVFSTTAGDGNLIVWSDAVTEADTTDPVMQLLCIRKSNTLADLMQTYRGITDKIYGYSIEYRPERQATLITFK